MYFCTRDHVLSSPGRVPPNIHKGSLLCGGKDKGAAKRDEKLVGKHALGVFRDDNKVLGVLNCFACFACQTLD